MVTTRSGKPLLAPTKPMSMKTKPKPASSIFIFDDSALEKRESPCKISKAEPKKAKVDTSLIDKENVINVVQPPPSSGVDVKKIQISCDEKMMNGAPEGDLYDMVVFEDAELWPFSGNHEATAELEKSLKAHNETAVWAEQYEAVVVMRRVLLHHTSLLNNSPKDLSSVVAAAVTGVESLRSCRVRNGILCLRTLLVKCGAALSTLPAGSSSSSSASPTTPCAAVVSCLLAKTGAGPKFIVELAQSALVKEGVRGVAPLLMIAFLPPFVGHRNLELAATAIAVLVGCVRRLDSTFFADLSEERTEQLKEAVQCLCTALGAKKAKAKEDARETLRYVHSAAGEARFQELLQRHLSESQVAEVRRALVSTGPASAPATPSSTAGQPGSTPLSVSTSRPSSVVRPPFSAGQPGLSTLGPKLPPSGAAAGPNRFRMHVQATARHAVSGEAGDMLCVAPRPQARVPNASPSMMVIATPISTVRCAGDDAAEVGGVAVRENLSGPVPDAQPMSAEQDTPAINVDSGSAEPKQGPLAPAPALSLREHILRMKAQQKRATALPHSVVDVRAPAAVEDRTNGGPEQMRDGIPSAEVESTSGAMDVTCTPSGVQGLMER